MRHYNNLLSILSKTYHALLLQPLPTYNVINELPTNTSDSFHRLSYLNSLSIPNSEIEAQSTFKLVLLATKNQQT